MYDAIADRFVNPMVVKYIVINTNNNFRITELLCEELEDGSHKVIAPKEFENKILNNSLHDDLSEVYNATMQNEKMISISVKKLEGKTNAQNE